MASEITEGVEAPRFGLPSQDGSDVNLEDLRDKWVVLYFYPRDNTSGCTKEAIEFSQLKSEFEALNAVVVGVSKDSVASHQKFVDKHDLTVTLLSDPDKEVLDTYGAWRLKKTAGKESMGVVRSTVIIDPKGVVVKTWPKVAKAAGHAEKVLDALKSIVQDASGK